jgi:hypothetical protein
MHSLRQLTLLRSQSIILRSEAKGGRPRNTSVDPSWLRLHQSRTDATSTLAGAGLHTKSDSPHFNSGGSLSRRSFKPGEPGICSMRSAPQFAAMERSRQLTRGVNKRKQRKLAEQRKPAPHTSAVGFRFFVRPMLDPVAGCSRFRYLCRTSGSDLGRLIDIEAPCSLPRVQTPRAVNLGEINGRNQRKW